jgi:hypothetical protein
MFDCIRLARNHHHSLLVLLGRIADTPLAGHHIEGIHSLALAQALDIVSIGFDHSHRIVEIVDQVEMTEPQAGKSWHQAEKFSPGLEFDLDWARCSSSTVVSDETGYRLEPQGRLPKS